MFLEEIVKNVKIEEKSPARIVIETRNQRGISRAHPTQHTVSLPILFPTSSGSDPTYPEVPEANKPEVHLYPEELYRSLDKRGDMPDINALFAGDMTERSEFKEKFLASLNSQGKTGSTNDEYKPEVSLESGSNSGDSRGHFKAQAYGNVFTVIITYLCIVAVYLTAFRVALATRESEASHQVQIAKARVETLQIFFKEKSNEINVKQIDVIV